MKAVWIFLAALSTADMLAQSTTTNKVDITLIDSGDCKGAPSSLSLVLGGRDRPSYPVHQDKSDPCHYSGRIPGDAFTIRKTPFSVRFGGARSYCRVAGDMEDDTDANLSVGELTFRYVPGSARNLSVEFQPSIFGIRYVRTYPPDKDDEASVPCREIWEFTGGETIRDVMFDEPALNRKGETLAVKFFSKSGETKWIIFDDLIQKTLRDKNSLPMNADAIGEAYMRQHHLDPTETPGIRVESLSFIARELKDKGFKQVLLKLE